MAERPDNHVSELSKLGLSKEQQEQVLNEAVDPAVSPGEFALTIQKLKSLGSLGK